MSGILDNVLGTLLNDEVSGKMADNLGVEKTKAKTALASAVPILMQALKRNASTPEGEKSLEHALEKDHSSSILDNVSGYVEKPNTSEGSKILDHILGSKRNTVEEYVSKDSGLPTSIVDKLLSSATPILMGALAGKKGTSNSGIGSILNNVSGEIKEKASPDEQNFIEKLLDQNNDGNIMDDVTKIGTSLLGKFFNK